MYGKTAITESRFDSKIYAALMLTINDNSFYVRFVADILVHRNWSSPPFVMMTEQYVPVKR